MRNFFLQYCTGISVELCNITSGNEWNKRAKYIFPINIENVMNINSRNKQKGERNQGASL